MALHERARAELRERHRGQVWAVARGGLAAVDDLLPSGHASNMATKVDPMLEEALALPADDRARLAAKLLASLPGKPAVPPRKLLDLAGWGAGVWGGLYSHARASARRMALGGPLAGARLIALDTAAFLYLIGGRGRGASARPAYATPTAFLGVVQSRGGRSDFAPASC